MHPKKTWYVTQTERNIFKIDKVAMGIYITAWASSKIIASSKTNFEFFFILITMYAPQFLQSLCLTICTLNLIFQISIDCSCDQIHRIPKPNKPNWDLVRGTGSTTQTPGTVVPYPWEANSRLGFDPWHQRVAILFANNIETADRIVILLLPTFETLICAMNPVPSCQSFTKF